MRNREPATAMFQEPGNGGSVKCRLCAHLCTLKPSKRGICKVRQNRDGVLVSLSYGMLSSMAVDPIEKKPLFHFLPATSSLSVATAGCNLSCPWCQNHSLSRMPGREQPIPGRWTAPDDIVSGALRARCATISYTYSEPTIFYEYARDIGIRARAAGLKNVFVTNGYMTPEAVREAASSFLDAANVDLKGATTRFYKHYCKAKLDAVKESIRVMHELGIWVEITTLLIPGLNDSEEDLRAIADFIVSVDASIPWHVSRFHPDSDFTHLPPTPIDSLRRAIEVGREAGVEYLYIGNAWGAGGEDTVCPRCATVIMSRFGFRTELMGIDGACCSSCGHRIAGVFA